ncbi:CRTAC1 family protein [Actinomycetota bacterium]
MTFIGAACVPMARASGIRVAADDDHRLQFKSAPVEPVRDHIWQGVRTVPPAFRHIDGWVSAVGAAAALTDVDRDGLANDVCLVDPRADTVTVTPAPTTGRRYEPFQLRPRGQRYESVEMAPTGCLPADLNEDGIRDFLVYYWGRSPVVFLGLEDKGPNASTYRSQDLMPHVENWASETALVADFDGDGHVDVLVGNYFPDSVDLLGRKGSSSQEATNAMPTSMSWAANGGRNRLLRTVASTSASSANGPSVTFEDASDSLTGIASTGWTLALGAHDLNSDQLPEVYVANDFGPDRLLLNTSTRGRVSFKEVRGKSGSTVPHSKVLGKDSFKGMGVDFGDLDGDRRTDIFVSNLTAPRGLVETHMAWVRSGGDDEFRSGKAPFVERADKLRLATSGWAWDAKLVDFDNDGQDEILQTTGFLRGPGRSAWPQLQELGTAQDTRLADVSNWPNFSYGLDISGHEPDALFTREPDGSWVDAAGRAKVDSDVPSRGVAPGDVNGDGLMDAVVAKQWAASTLLINTCRSCDGSLTVIPVIKNTQGSSKPVNLVGRATPANTSPAIGASVTLADGRTQQVDGGNGHASVRAPELHFGSKNNAAPINARVTWRDRNGKTHTWSTQLKPGVNTLVLGNGG